MRGIVRMAVRRNMTITEKLTSVQGKALEIIVKQFYMDEDPQT